MPAAEAGKNVFIEWKPGKGAQETMKIAEAIKSKDVKCLVGSQGKQSATLRKMKEFVSSDRIGRVFSTSAIITAGYEEAKKKTGSCNCFV
ncbi:unnamed protein product [Somion occarium]|uniref:Leucine-binding protein domain-containing protein n=1 Tax=Somion occarium TaxID=3059160 RepID=A0ABP1DYV0_9APHY